jgi:hypothetical protein
MKICTIGFSREILYGGEYVEDDFVVYKIVLVMDKRCFLMLTHHAMVEAVLFAKAIRPIRNLFSQIPYSKVIS